MKHNRSLCHECKEDGLCDGQPADDCQFMKLAAFETTFNDRLTKLNDQFATIQDILATKKDAFIEMYRKDPRISQEDAVSVLQRINEDFDPSYPERERDVMQQQLAELQEQLARQQNIIAEAEETKRRLAKTQQDKTNLEQRLNELKSSFSGVNRHNAELQSVLDNETKQKSNLTKELEELKRANLNFKIETEKLTQDLKAMTSSKFEADGRIKQLEGILQQTQTRLHHAERIKQAKKSRRWNET